MDSVWYQTDVYTTVTGSNLATIEYQFRQSNSRVATLMQDQITWTLAACTRVLRPLIRLALALGLKHPQLEGMLRELLLDEARRQLLARGVSKPNISQLAVATGINRKDVTIRVRLAENPLPRTDLSPAAQVFTAWLQLAANNPARRRIPLRAASRGASFESLARRASKGNVHHRAVLDDLVRLGMVIEHDDQVELTADGFVPAGDLKSMLAFLGDNTRDHLQAAVSNTLGESPRTLERAVFADGLAEGDCTRLHALVQKRWDKLHHEMVREMGAAIDRSGSAGKQRMKVGIYVLFEESEDALSAAADVTPAVPAKASRRRP